MYIVIVGGGNVGYHLARVLLNEGHEVLIIEKSPARCRLIEEELGEICLVGDGSQVATLRKGGAERADMLVALTNSDEDNLIACQIAKHQFHVYRTIARLSNPQYEKLFKELGVDIIISSTELILEHIEQEVPTHPLTHLLEEKNFCLVEAKLLPHSGAVGKRIKEIALPDGVIPFLLLRGSYPPFTVGQETLLQADDRLIIALPPEVEEEVKRLLCGEG